MFDSSFDGFHDDVCFSCRRCLGCDLDPGSSGCLLGSFSDLSVPTYDSCWYPGHDLFDDEMDIGN